MVPLSSLTLAHKALTDRVSTGIPALDEMMEGKGFFRGSSVLVSGTAGTGKSSLAANFASAACARWRRLPVFRF
ncbi:MAG: ATPase domain-containing protein [Terriglobales bacterium]